MSENKNIKESELMSTIEVLNQTYDKIYIMSLEKSVDRHSMFRERLKGLNFTVSWGVDGQKLDIKTLEEEGLYDSEAAKSIKKDMNIPPQDVSMGHIGCALSHVKVYKDVVKNGYEKVLIMEDDIIMDYNKGQYLLNAMKELPPDWELLYLGYLYNNSKVTFKAWLRINMIYPLLSLLGYDKYNAHRYRCKFPRQYSKHLEKAGYHYGAHAYAVTQSGAKKILERQSPVVMEADNVISDMCMNEEINAYRLKTRIFHQDREQFESLISSGERV